MKCVEKDYIYFVTFSRHLKKRNQHRSPLDDKVGSYDVIGRINFKTCENPTSEYVPHEPVTNVVNLYSVLAIPTAQLCDITSFPFPALVSNNVLQSVIGSQKSFNTGNGKISSSPNGIKIWNNDGLIFRMNASEKSSQTISNKAVQCTNSQKFWKNIKWLHIFLGCISVPQYDN